MSKVSPMNIPDAAVAQKAHSATTDIKAPRNICDMPIEILSKVFLDTLDPLDAVDPVFNPSSNAVTLLNISHASSFLREAVIGDSSLWAVVPYLNGIHTDFLKAILERSQQTAINLTLLDDGRVWEADENWNEARWHFDRISKLHIEVDPISEGFILHTFLSRPAPSLTECRIHFVGFRNVPLNKLLNSRDPRLFDDDAPHLHTLKLTNCWIRPKHYSSLPSLRQVAVQSQYNSDRAYREGHSFMALEDLLGGHSLANSFIYLQDLALINCIQHSDRPEGPTFQQPIHLPSLERFTLETTIGDCHQLATNFRLPKTCSRIITSTSHRHRQLKLEDASAAGVALSLFVPSDAPNTHCAVGTSDLTPFLRFTNSYSTVTLRLRLPGRKDPHFDAHMFLVEVGMALAPALGTRVSTISTVHLQFEKLSPSSGLLLPLLRLMDVKEITSQSSELWADPCIQALARHENVPSLRKLQMPLEDSICEAEDLAGVSRFLRSREDVQEIVFQVDLSRLGDMEHDEMDSVIRDLTRNFPSTVDLKWVAS
ncbi:hypothetical protein DFP72DRAFT_1077354 [Ephemerocybe angulata]|uniref:F-box domain-containing protein n=1 Tax=Ephemerocybe angulata TaxID=980116 RepID=A0A8H6HGY2_9AGAR|nr:hypothetical protein DFP72DRAFT_1077354 [Tulosesus angulatus]